MAWYDKYDTSKKKKKKQPSQGLVDFSGATYQPSYKQQPMQPIQQPSLGRRFVGGAQQFGEGARVPIQSLLDLLRKLPPSQYVTPYLRKKLGKVPQPTTPSFTELLRRLPHATAPQTTAGKIARGAGRIAGELPAFAAADIGAAGVLGRIAPKVAKTGLGALERAGLSFGAIGQLEPGTTEERLKRIPRDVATGVITAGVGKLAGKALLKYKSARGIEKELKPITEDAIGIYKKQIGVGAKEQGKGIKQLLGDLYTSTVNRFAPIERYAKRAEKITGAKLETGKNPAVLAQLYAGSVGKAQYKIEKEFNPIIESIKPQLDDFKVLLKAERDIELANRGIKGSDKELALKAINQIHSKYGNEVFGKLSKASQAIHSFNNNLLKTLSDNGFLSQETYNKITSSNQKYVPFYRILENVDRELGIPKQKGAFSVAAHGVKKIVGSERQIQDPILSIYENIYKYNDIIERNNVAKSIVNLGNNVKELGVKRAKEAGPETIALWENGKKAFYSVPEDVATAAKGLSEEASNLLINILAAPARVFRAAATSNNPEFFLTNVIRDQFDAAVNAKHGYVPVWDFMKGLYHYLKKDDMYFDWLRSGGSQSFLVSTGKDALRESVESLKPTLTIGGKIQKVLKKPLEILEAISQASEIPTRLGVYGRAVAKTGNKQLAALESREATLDFARRGAKTKTANMMIAFLNARIQGIDKMVRTIRTNPKKALSRVAILAGLPTIGTYLYNNKYYPEGYKNVPSYVKDTNFVMMLNDKDYITIPKGFIIRAFANPIESTMEYIKHRDPKALNQLAFDLLGSFSPVGQTSKSEIGEFARTAAGELLPTALRPIAEQTINKSFFTGKDIVPFYLKNKQVRKQSFNFTPEIYKKLGERLNVSPLVIKFYLESYLPGYAKLGAASAQPLFGKKLEPNEIPLLRRFKRQNYQ